MHLYKGLADSRALKKKAKETKALQFTWRAVASTLAEIKPEKTIAAAAIETLETCGSAGCSSSGKETDAGLTERRAETRAEPRVARSFGLAARKPVKNAAARARSLQELLNSAEPDVTLPTAEGGMAANAEAETPDPAGGAQASQRDSGSPAVLPKMAEQQRDPKAPPKAAEGNPPHPAEQRNVRQQHGFCGFVTCKAKAGRGVSPGMGRNTKNCYEK